MCQPDEESQVLLHEDADPTATYKLVNQSPTLLRKLSLDPADRAGQPECAPKKARGTNVLFAFGDLVAEAFDPLLLLTPYLFISVGIQNSSMIMAVALLVQIACAKLLFESTKLQRENLYLAKNEDFESLIGFTRLNSSIMLRLVSKLYPLQLIASAMVGITIACRVCDEVLSSLVFQDDGEHKYVFGVLPALDANRHPVANTELVRLSRGFILCLTIILVAGVISCFREIQTVRIAQAEITMVRLIAVASLLLTAIFMVPQKVLATIGSAPDGFLSLNVAQGTDKSGLNTLFIAGVLAFSGAIHLIKVPEIASSHKRDSLPIASAFTTATLIRWAFGAIVSTSLVNLSGETAEEMTTFSLVGALIFLVIYVLPQIQADQANVQQLLYCRGEIDLPVSLLAAFITPWLVGALVHEYATILSMACFCACTTAVLVAYMSPFLFYCQTVDEASAFEANFRLSLQQMYSGDRLSRKETSVLPKHCRLMEVDLSQEGANFSAALTDCTSMLAKSYLDRPAYVNTPGTIKCRSYPTSLMLRQSKMGSIEFDSDCATEMDPSDADRQLDIPEVPSNDEESQYSEFVNLKEEEESAIDSAKLLRVLNSQGHYGVKQSLEQLFWAHPSAKCQAYLLELTRLVAVAVLVFNFAALFAWTHAEVPKVILNSLYSVAMNSASEAI